MVSIVANEPRKSYDENVCVCAKTVRVNYSACDFGHKKTHRNDEEEAERSSATGENLWAKERKETEKHLSREIPLDKTEVIKDVYILCAFN